MDSNHHPGGTSSCKSSTQSGEESKNLIWWYRRFFLCNLTPWCTYSSLYYSARLSSRYSVNLHQQSGFGLISSSSWLYGHLQGKLKCGSISLHRCPIVEVAPGIIRDSFLFRTGRLKPCLNKLPPSLHVPDLINSRRLRRHQKDTVLSTPREYRTTFSTSMGHPFVKQGRCSPKTKTPITEN